MSNLPLTGIRVVEFSHMVMGPTCGMILADLGAEVIKIEPPGGDRTRSLPGLGIGFFRNFNRNKKSVVLDLKQTTDREQAKALIKTSDVVVENFRPGLMQEWGLDYEQLKADNPQLIYASNKGFLPGPYEHRLALDEVVQMMGGLAYMTGPEGQPLRAGTSVNDIMGGMFAAIGVLAALQQRHKTHQGQEIQSALFENCVFLSSQHMQQFAMSGAIPPPMPNRVSAWSVYDVFTVKNSEQVFVAAVSERQWLILCEILEANELKENPDFATNATRVAHRAELLAQLGEYFRHWDKQQLMQKLEEAGLPYAPIVRPDELWSDPHLLESGGIAAMQDETGAPAQALLLPLLMDGERLAVRQALPAIGQHNDEFLKTQ